jgi:Ca-activated chloride channel family protein
MLVMDASGSMRADDIKPDRISAAKDAARAFIDAQPRDAKVGIVSLAATAAVAQSPTRKREALHEAIERFQLQRGTALGSGIVVALTTLLPEAGIDAEKHINGYSTRSMYGAPVEPPKPVAPGSNGAVAIVLLSDGQSNTGPDPLKMAQLAADHGVRVHTVGIGTAEGATLTVNGWSMRVRLDEEALKKIAAVTHADYFHAASAAELKRIYGSLATRLAVEKKRPTEVTALFAALGAFLASVAALLSLLWHGRIL